MKNCLIFLFFYVNTSFSQRLYVFDSESKKIIPYVNVSYIKYDNIIDADYCNEDGFIDIKSKENFDKIEFSCIGYENKLINTINDTIFLIKKIITLNEVVISKKNLTFSKLGYTKCKKKTTLSASRGFQLCVYIENTFQEKKVIKSVLFKVKRRDNFKTAIRIHFYKKQIEKLEPAEEILTEDIIRYFDEKSKENIEIDVSKYGLELPIEGAFVGIEWLGIVDWKTGEFIESKEFWSDTSIELNDSINKPFTFMKSRIKKHDWINTEKIKEDLKETLKFKNYPNASFGIKVFNQ